jgi:hypothetical protein
VALVRAYPRAVAGVIRSYRFDADTRQGRLDFTSVAGVTEIAAPVRLFPSGVDATLTGSRGRVAWDGQQGVLLVATDVAGAATVTFRPR